MQLQLGFGFARSPYDGDHADDARLSMRAGLGAERRYRAWSFLVIAHAVFVKDNDDVVTMFGNGYDDYNIARETVLGVSLSADAIYHWGAEPRPARFGGPERPRR